MKRKFLSIIVFIIISAMVYLFYSYFFKNIDYDFSTSYFKESEIIKKGGEFKKEVITLGLKDKIISSDKYSTQLKLSRYELNKVLHSKRTNKYIHSYQKVEDSGIGIVTESPI